MTSRKSYSLSANCLLLVSVLFHFSQAVLAAPQLSGSYKIVETKDLGTKVRVTLELHLSNPGLDRLLITQLGLRNPLRPPQVEDSGPAIAVEAQASSEFTREFNVDKDEYQLWLKGSRPRLSVTFQSSDGTQATIIISLMRRLS
jgi:hypothetical protein